MKSHAFALLRYWPFWAGVAVVLGALADISSILSRLGKPAQAAVTIQVRTEEQLLELPEKWTVGSILPLDPDAVDTVVAETQEVPATAVKDDDGALPEKLRRSLEASANGQFAVALALLPSNATLEKNAVTKTDRKLASLAYQIRGRSLAALLRWGESLDSLERARAEHRMQPNLEIAIAVCLRNLGRHQAARQTLEKVLDWYRESSSYQAGTWSYGYYSALFEHAVVLRKQGYPEAAAIDFDQAIELRLRRNDSPNKRSEAVRLAYAFSSRGNAYADAGQWESAIRDSSAAVESYRSAFRDRADDPERWRFATLLCNRARTYAAAENWKLADTSLEQATEELDAAKQQHANASYWLVDTAIRLNHTTTLQKLQRHHDALRVVNECIDVLTSHECRSAKSKGARWRYLSEAHRQRAACAQTPKSREESRESSVRFARQAMADSPGLDSMRTLARSLTDRGNAFLRRNDHKRALADFEEGIAGLQPLAKKVKSSSVDSELAKLFARRGETQRRRNQVELAIVDFERAIAIREQLLAAGFTASLAAKNAALRNNVGALLLQKQEFEQASEAFGAAARDYARALELSDSRDHRHLLATVYQNRSTALAQARQRDQALAALQQGIDVMEALFAEDPCPKHGETLFVQLGQRAFAIDVDDHRAAQVAANRALEIDASTELPDKSKVRIIRAACKRIAEG